METHICCNVMLVCRLSCWPCIVGIDSVHADRVTGSEVAVRRDKRAIFFFFSETEQSRSNMSDRHTHTQKTKHTHTHTTLSIATETETDWQMHGGTDVKTLSASNQWLSRQEVGRRRKKHCNAVQIKEEVGDSPFWKGGEWGCGFTHPDSPPWVGG